MDKILIFIPTYNERDNAPLMVKEISALGINADLLFVDDNSPDGTGALLEDIKADFPRLIVHHRAGKLGIGSAHSESIFWAYDQGYNKLISLDCDFTHSPSDIHEMLRKSELYDVVIGSRWVKRNSLPGWNAFRRGMTYLGHFLTRNVLGLAQDASGAFRVYNLENIPKALFQLVKSKGYAFFFESLYLFNRNGLSIGEVPISLPARTYGSSKMTAIAAVRSARYIFRLFFEDLRCPEQFLIENTQLNFDPSLEDPQSWDDYWNRSEKAGDAIYAIIAGIYRRSVIKMNLQKSITKVFPSGAKLLHAGCGSGQVDVSIQKTMRLSALDISTNALRLYNKNNPNAEEVRHGTIFDLPFENGSFDGVYNLGVMEHFSSEEIRKILGEFHRVLKSDGQIVIFWPHANATSVMVLGFCHRFMRSVMKSHKKLHPPEISLLRSKSHAKEILRNSGFQLTAYQFGFRDFFIQSTLVAKKESASI